MKMTTVICDRCRTDCTIDPGRNHLAVKAGNLTRGPRSEGVDLCGDCSARLLEWLDHEPNTEQNASDSHYLKTVST